MSKNGTESVDIGDKGDGKGGGLDDGKGSGDVVGPPEPDEAVRIEDKGDGPSGR